MNARRLSMVLALALASLLVSAFALWPRGQPPSAPRAERGYAEPATHPSEERSRLAPQPARERARGIWM